MKGKKLVGFVTLLVMVFAMNTMVFAAETLTNNKSKSGTLTGGHGNEAIKEYSFNIKKQGYIAVTITGKYNGTAVDDDWDEGSDGKVHVDLLDKNKKMIVTVLSELEGLLDESGEYSSLKTTEYIPVKKGNYVFRVSGYNAKYSIKYKFTNVKSYNKATKRKKAPTLKKGKEVTGLVFKGDTKTVYYKVKVDKSKKISFDFGCDSKYEEYGTFISAVRITLLNSKGKKIKWDKSGYSKKVKKGTYYIKVTKDYLEDEDTSKKYYGTSVYRLKWKK